MNGAGLLRDSAVTTLIFGVAALVWFAWGREDPPKRWRAPLLAGTVLSLVMVIIGGLLTWQLWSADSVFDDGATREAFGIVCGIEFGLSGLGAAVLGIAKRPRLIAPWVLFVVGGHFVPLAGILRDPGLHVLALLLVAGSVLAVILHRRRGITPSAVTALAGGGSLVVFAVRAAVLALT